MKKLLMILVLGLLFSSPTLGRDCSIKTPNFDWSQKGWIFDGKEVYEDKGLGESFHLKSPIRNKSLSYYSYNLGLNSIDEKILHKQLSNAVWCIEDKISRNKKRTLKDQAYNLPADIFMNNLDMKKFISKGAYVESLFETSSGSKRYIDIVTVGTDNYCIYKIRYSSQVAQDPNPIAYTLSLFERDLKLFYKIIKNK